MIKSVKPAGHRVLVKVDEVEEVSAGGIIIAHDNKNRVKAAGVVGTLTKIGPSAWKDFSDGKPWASEGDRVLYAQHAGYTVDVDGVTFRMMNDEDIVAIVEEA
uniref:Co-chaperonin GroES n=1 Tax=uncultured virus TaxID=340016 RepID=A0A221S441_9VIRU|nr:co-chaperonin GroES [uncultured virus]